MCQKVFPTFIRLDFAEQVSEIEIIPASSECFDHILFVTLLRNLTQLINEHVNVTKQLLITFLNDFPRKLVVIRGPILVKNFLKGSTLDILSLEFLFQIGLKLLQRFQGVEDDLGIQARHIVNNHL